MDPEHLQKQREALAELDARILALIAQRQRRSLDIGRTKAALGQGTRDFARERVVLERARHHASREGLDPDLGQRLLALLIEASLSVQEQDRITTASTGDGRRAVLLGGAGAMGRWFRSHLAAQGWDIVVSDPAQPDSPDLSEILPTLSPDDLLVLATPTAETARILRGLVGSPPPSILVEISSTKTPLIEPLAQLRKADAQVVSLHPLFGPRTSLLSGRRVLVCDLGAPRATQLVHELFEPTLADLVHVPLRQHDALVAWVLHASHAASLLFAEALSHSPFGAGQVLAMGSETFDAQREVALRLLSERPELHAELHAHNPTAPAIISAFQRALTTLQAAQGDPALMAALMERGRRYLSEPEAPPAPSNG